MLAKEDYEHYLEMEDKWWMNYKTLPAENVTAEVNSRIAKLEQKI